MDLTAAFERIFTLIRDTQLEQAETEILSFKQQHPEIDTNYAEMILLAHQTQYQKAFNLGEKLLLTRSQDHLVRFYQARNAIAVGQWKKGLELFDSVRGHSVFGGEYLTDQKPLWTGEALHGRTLLIACEGGIGDAVCFARFVKNFSQMGAKVILAAYEPLFEILHPIEGMSALIDISVATKVDFDFWVPALSCPRILGLDFSQIDGAPFLVCPESQNTKWAELIKSSKPKVGISWQGNPGFKEDYVRSIPGEQFAPLVALQEYDFFKIQINAENNSFKHPNLKDLSSHVQGPSDLAGFLQQLDLFITVDSGMAHIAGALGIPTILLNRVMGWFTFGHMPDHENLQSTPWYNSMKILHQKRWGQWEETILRTIPAIPKMLMNPARSN
jgi:hypothetical protein